MTYRTHCGMNGRCTQLGGGRPRVLRMAEERGVRYGIQSDGCGNCWFGGGLGTLHGGGNLYIWQRTVDISLKKKQLPNDLPNTPWYGPPVGWWKAPSLEDGRGGGRYRTQSDGGGKWWFVTWFGGGLGTLHGGGNLYTWQRTVDISLKKKIAE